MVAALIQTASALTYLPYLFGIEPVPRPLLAVVMGAALVWAGGPLRRKRSEPIPVGDCLTVKAP